MILDAIRKVPTATVLLNGDSPLFYKRSFPNPVQYFGFDLEKGPAKLAHYNTEGILCPDCQSILKYELNTYANLGAYICENCGCNVLTRLSSDRIGGIDQQSFPLCYWRPRYGIQIGGLYNIYNALAAVAIARYLGADSQLNQTKDLTRVVQFLDAKKPSIIGDKECTLILIKNPVGATQAIEMIKLAPYPFSLSVLLNANYADGIDTSWIWDADLNKLLRWIFQKSTLVEFVILKLLVVFE